MKEIDKKDTPDVSGGYTPRDGGCIPTLPTLPGSTGVPTIGPVIPDALEPIDPYPRNPATQWVSDSTGD